jgi:flagellar biogenesis protein FliO
MEAYLYIKALLVLIFLLSIFGICIVLMKFLKNKKFYQYNKNSDLRITDTMQIDFKRKLIVCKFRRKEYVILLGDKDKVIDVIDAKK